MILGLIAAGLFSTASYGAAVTTIDTNCNPTIDPPVTGGCTWNNFYESIATGAPFGTGSSFSNYYVAAGSDPWTIASTTGYFTLRVLDGGHQGDTFSVYDNGVLLGPTSSTPVDINHTCANDPTDSIMGVSPGEDPASCWNDSLFSRGTFLLTPNASGHSLDILWLQEITGGDSSIQWFEVNTASAPSSVPEPGSLVLIGTGLAGLAIVRRRYSNRRTNRNTVG